MTLRCSARGAAHPFFLVFGVSLMIGGGLVGLLCWNSTSPAQIGGGERQPLILFCGASLKPVLEVVIRDYKKEYGVEVQPQYDASDNLLNSISVTHIGDLFLPAEELYAARARQKGLAREILPLGRTRPVIAVRKGNPKNIHDISDLLRPDVSVTLASPAAAIGRLSRELLQKSGNWDALHKRMENEGSKVSELGKEPEVANSVKLGAADAGIIWETSAPRYPELESVCPPLFQSAEQPVAITVLESAKSPARALHFARYLAAHDRGLLEFKKAGYRVVDGDDWEDQPKLLLFAGAMLRPAIEKTLKEFEAREGIPSITTVYNGCGILVGQMHATHPDVYFSCDTSFMKQVQPLFDSPEAISANKMVILVAKGNPMGIHSLRDLAKPGLKLGIGNEQQCALGWLTHNVLDRAKLCEAIEENHPVRSPTGDFLVNQTRTGALDAAIVYESNTTFVKEALDIIPIDLDQQFAVQPIAVGRNSKHKYLAERMLDAIRTPASEKRFKENGFQWIAKEPVNN